MALVPAGLDLHAVEVVPAGTRYEVFIGGERGLVLRFSGAGWTLPKSQTSLTISGLSFANAQLGFAVGGVQEGLSVIVGTSA